MEQQARIGGFFEGGLKASTSVVGKSGVNPTVSAAAPALVLSTRQVWIECGEQLIGRMHLGGGNAIE